MRVKSLKSLAMGVPALGALGAAAVGATSISSLAAGNPVQVRLAAIGAPQPHNPPPAPAPGANVQTAGQLTGLLNSLADPSVPFANKGNLVEGGISGTEAHMADHELKKAAKNGDLPLGFNITTIQSGAPGSVTADVAVSGPKIPSPVTQNVTFVNQGSWMLSRSSAMELLQAAGH
ncbi:MAG: mtb12 2 [Mycobacterium sp.]|nr:mtb12 2 [Mycobacterium sp.]